LHHVVLEGWSRRGSVLHRRDARAKALALLAFLILLATAHRGFPALASAYFLLLAGALAAARLPMAQALGKAAIVLPFSLLFAAASWLAGDPQRALHLVVKSYLSALAAVWLASTTPLAELLRGLEALGLPRFLVAVAQFVYRYLFVVSEQAQHMRLAAAARGGRLLRLGFQAAAGAVAVLFARSYARAEGVHAAMLARGFEGRFHPLTPPRFTAADAAFLLVAITLPAVARWYLAG